MENLNDYIDEEIEREVNKIEPNNPGFKERVKDAVVGFVKETLAKGAVILAIAKAMRSKEEIQRPNVEVCLDDNTKESYAVITYKGWVIKGKYPEVAAEVQSIIDDSRISLAEKAKLLKEEYNLKVESRPYDASEFGDDGDKNQPTEPGFNG